MVLQSLIREEGDGSFPLATLIGLKNIAGDTEGRMARFVLGNPSRMMSSIPQTGLSWIWFFEIKHTTNKDLAHDGRQHRNPLGVPPMVQANSLADDVALWWGEAGEGL